MNCLLHLELCNNAQRRAFLELVSRTSELRNSCQVLADLTFLSWGNVGRGSKKIENLIFGMKKKKTATENKPWTVKGNIVVTETLVMKNIVLTLKQVLKVKKSQIHSNIFSSKFYFSDYCFFTTVHFNWPGVVIFPALFFALYLFFFLFSKDECHNCHYLVAF